MILFVLLLFAVAAVTLYQPQKVKAAEKEFIVGFDAGNFRHMAILTKMVSMSDLTLILPKKFVTAMAGNCKTTDFLGFERFRTGFRSDFLYLEWFYDERT